MAPQLRRRRFYRIRIPVLSRVCPNLAITIPLALSTHLIIQVISSSALYLLGPVLILVTAGLLYSLSWTFWSIILPLQFHGYTSPAAIANQAFVIFILCNIIFNYLSCVSTKNFASKDYENVVRELARATGFDYPESQEDMEKWRLEWREAIMERSRQKRLRDRYELTRNQAVIRIQLHQMGMHRHHHRNRLSMMPYKRERRGYNLCRWEGHGCGWVHTTGPIANERNYPSRREAITIT